MQKEEYRAELLAEGSDGQNALMVAARKGYVKTVETLLEFGIDREVKDNSGKTAKQYAQEVAKENQLGKAASNNILEANCKEVARILSRQLTRERPKTDIEYIKPPSEKTLELRKIAAKMRELEDAARWSLKGQGFLHIPRYDFVRAENPTHFIAKQNDLGKWLEENVSSRLKYGKIVITGEDLRFVGITKMEELQPLLDTNRAPEEYCKLMGDERLCKFFTAEIKIHKDDQKSGIFQPFNAIFEGIHFDETEHQIFGSVKLRGAFFKNCDFTNVNFKGISPEDIATMRFEGCKGLKNIKFPDGVVLPIKGESVGKVSPMVDNGNLQLRDSTSYSLQRLLGGPASSPSNPTGVPVARIRNYFRNS